MMEGQKTKREILYPQNLSKPVRAWVEELEKRALKNEDTVLGSDTPESDEIKPQAYAYIAYFLQKIHERTPSLVGKDGKIQLLTKMCYPPDLISHRPISPKYIGQEGGSVFRRVAEIKNAYLSKFIEEMRKFEVQVKKRSLRQKEKTFDQKAYARMEKVVALRPKGANRRVEEFIARGALTASEVSWDTLCAIPIAYFRKHGRVISPEEFRQIAATAEPLMIQLAALHFDSLKALDDFSKEDADKQNLDMKLQFPLEFFSIIEKNGKELLDFDPEAIAAFQTFMEKHGIKSTDSRALCPALNAMVPNTEGEKENLVSVVFDQYKAIADSFLVPFLERYTNDALNPPEDPLEGLV